MVRCQKYLHFLLHFLKDKFVETASEVNLKELMLTFGSFVGSRKPDVCWGDKQILEPPNISKDPCIFLILGRRHISL